MEEPILQRADNGPCLKYPIDVERLLRIVKSQGGDQNAQEVVSAVASLMNRAYAQGLKDGEAAQG